jgi:hypothetical protein
MSRIAGRFARVEPRRRYGIWCWGCCRTCRARTAGASPGRPVRPPRTACSTCPAGPGGMPAPCAMTCARAATPPVSSASHRHRREDRERVSRRLPRLRGTGRARGGGPGAVHPALVDVRCGPLPGRGPGRGHRLCGQTGTGRPDDRPVPRCRAPRRPGRGRRGLRRQPEAALRAGKSARRPTCSPSPAHMKSSPMRGSSARMPWPRRCPGEPGRSYRPGRCQGAPLLRQGRHRPGRTPSRPPPAADPPQPHHR